MVAGQRAQFCQKFLFLLSGAGFCFFFYGAWHDFHPLASLRSSPRLIQNSSPERQEIALQHVQNTSQVKERQRLVIYSVSRPDRSGAFVLDMLFAHAYAFATNSTYGGACDHGVQAKHQNITKQLIFDLGLSSFLTCACPPLEAESASAQEKAYTRHVILDRKIYRRKTSRAFTSEWRRHIQPLLHLPDIKMNSSGDLKVVVHIRRGDVSPCNKFASRYLTNEHYNRLLNRYVIEPFKKEKIGKQNMTITIHSEKNSHEPWDYGYWLEAVNATNDQTISVKLELSQSLQRTWLDMMTADILITSISTFSFVAAALNLFASKIIYTPFGHEPLQDWVIVDQDLLQKTSPEVEEMKNRCRNESSNVSKLS